MNARPLKVSYLLAVWGEQYIRQFMDLSLRTLLAPNNIPALSEHAECSFVFLTRKIDRKTFVTHPLFKRLEHYCKVEFVTIDDLIFHGNYSATLTLAYERGMRHVGEAMLSTYFIYLVADYVMADGSLINLLPYMQRGVSGITAGNYQVVEEDLLETFQLRIDPVTGVIAIPPRELVAMTMPHLHPLTIANIANQNSSHTEHTNRLFWRVDGQTLIGRFYLRHMLCIRPEIDNYVIGASCDYSYITEMCPSGNVVNIADSDEYLVIELQPFGHEQAFIRPGRFNPKAMIHALGEWVTAAHRENAFSPVVFHAQELSPQTEKILAESHRYMELIDRQLPLKPQPLRGHPYWISCIEGILESLIALNNQEDYYRRGVFGGVVGSNVFEPPLGKTYGDYNLLKMIRYRYVTDWRATAIKLIRALSGNEAECKIWHREYAHSRAISTAIARAASRSDHFLFIAYEPTSYADWCHKEYGDCAILQKAELFGVRSQELMKQQSKNASEAIILLPVTYLHKLGELLAKCNVCLSGEKRVTVIVTQRYFARGGMSFKEHLAVLAAYYESNSVEVESFTTITQPLRKWLDVGYQHNVRLVMNSNLSPWAIAKRIIPMISIFVVSVGYTIGNLFSYRLHQIRRGNPTCAIIRLKLTGANYMALGCERKMREETYD